jgi:CRP/FNR family transcriptional regulator, cyclic AMP receptor protein
MDATLDTFLHHLPVMAGVDDDALAFLGNMAHEEVFAAGEIIVREGEPGERMFFVCDGRVTVVKDFDSEHPVSLAEFGPGDYFGEMSLVESVTRCATVIAEEDTRVFTLRGVALYKLYRTRPEQYGIVMLNIARDLARRLRSLDVRFVAVSH